MNAFVPVRALSAEHVLFNILAHIVDNWFRAHFVKYVTQNQVYINLKYCLYQQIYDILQTINTFINTGNFNKLLTSTLQRRHHERKGVSNHRRLDCLLNDLFRRRSRHQSSASLAYVMGTTGDRWIPLTKGQERGKCFHLITLSWILMKCCIWALIKAFP